MLRKDFDEVWQGLLPTTTSNIDIDIDSVNAAPSNSSTTPIISSSQSSLASTVKLKQLTHSNSSSAHGYLGYDLSTNQVRQTDTKVNRESKVYQRLSNSPSLIDQTSVMMHSGNPEQDSLSPHSTVTTETGDQLLYRMKQATTSSTSALKHQMSWTSSSARNEANTINSSQREKFSIKQIAIFPPRVKRRVVFKNGNINVNKERVEKRHQRYLQDTFTTMVDIQWRWNLLVFALGFILSWLAFAVVWWVICLAHGDFDHLGDKDWTPW